MSGAGRLPRLEDCDCYTEPTRDGLKFVGRVRQFSNLRTRPKALALDAIDEIVTLTRDHITRLTAENERLGDGSWPAASG